MNISAAFIRRPVAATLLAIGLASAGYFAYHLLPVAALPRADFPTISVSSQLAGASPDTMATAVSIPLIKQFETIAGIDTITTRNALGTSNIVLQFDLSRNIDAAAADVQSAIDRTTKQLPQNMTAAPSYRKTNPADAPVLMISLHSDTLPMTDLDALVENIVEPAVSTVAGVSEADIYGQQKYAVRIEVNPQKLAGRKLALTQVVGAVASANNQSPVGTMQNDHQTITIDTNTQREDAKGFDPLIIASPGGNPVRVRDIGRAVDSAENSYLASWHNSDHSITLAVFRQPDANTVAVVDGVRKQLPRIMQQLPSSVAVDIINDNAVQIRAAVEDVQYTLFLTVGLVILVIYLFLGKAILTVIPAIAVPLSILVTYGAMLLMGYSVDNMSLLALTLSVGLVVDDAIVMLENIMHHIEHGEHPFEAALKGSGEVSATIVSMSVSLIAVFMPIVFLGGVVGRIFTEFGLVVSMAIAASATVSLVVTPMLAARLPQRIGDPVSARTPAGLFNIGFTAVQRRYGRSVGWCLKHRLVILGLFALTVLASLLLAVTLPKGFLPQEDTGQLQIAVQGRQDISFNDMKVMQDKVSKVLLANKDVDQFISSMGGGPSAAMNAANFYVQLKPKQQRGPIGATVASLRREFGKIVGINAYVVVRQTLQLGGRTTQSLYQFVLEDLDARELRQWAQKMQAAMTADRGHFVDVATDLQDNAMEARVVVDKDHASQLGVNADTIRNELDYGFGTYEASTIQKNGDNYQVIVEYDPNLTWNNDLLSNIQVKSNSGAMVPLSSFAHVEREAGPVTVNQTGQLTSITLSFNLPEGVALSQATDRIEQLKKEIGLPSSVYTAYSGTAQVFAQATQNTPALIIAAVLTIYVVLGVLYESFLHPLTILSGLPAAAFGALVALQLVGMDLSIIALIGILMLIGIVKKNAIMMIDVALQLKRDELLSSDAAIHEACVRRFRPIMMTTFCALLGTLPIAIGGGASSELRQPLGIAVVGGLVVSQLLTLFITPVIFVEFERLSAFLGALGRRFNRRRAKEGASGEAHSAPRPHHDRPALIGNEAMQPGE